MTRNLEPSQRVDDLHPAITASADARIKAWATEAYGQALADLQRGVEAGLKDRGFAS